ncbi:MAG: phosphate ABC transporter permease PtsA [Syntrophorhabdales bacterium]
MKGSPTNRRIFYDKLFKALVIVMSFITILPMFFILFFIVRNGISVIDWNFLVSLPKPMGEPGGGISNAVVGTVILILISSLISIPLGILAGIYLSEYRMDRFTYFSRLSLEILQGIPSIVIGIIAYVWIVMPIGSFSAVILPAGLSGIVTGIILGIARIAGETAPLLFTAFGSPFMNLNIFKPVNSLPLLVFNYATSPYPEWHALAWGASFVLLVFVLTLNIVAKTVTRRWNVRF